MAGAGVAVRPRLPRWSGWLLGGPGRWALGRSSRGAGLGSWSGGQAPGAVLAGQAVAEQGAQVHRGGAALEPGVVLGFSAVAELDPASPPGGNLGDGTFDV